MGLRSPFLHVAMNEVILRSKISLRFMILAGELAPSSSCFIDLFLAVKELCTGEMRFDESSRMLKCNAPPAPEEGK